MSHAAPALPVVCPRCGGRLGLEPASARCQGCGAGYSEEEGIVHLVVGRAGAPGYDPHYFRTLPQVEGEHFWFVGRRAVILEALEREVSDWRERPLFDVGCGSGGLLAYLADAGVSLSGACDAYLDGLRLARPRVGGVLALVDEGRLPPLAPGQSMIGLFDVLEHIDDDSGTLRFLHSVLEPGGVLLMTVPAHAFLFDEMDELAGHRRRYRRRELARKLRDAGFEILRLRHFMSTLVPLLLGVRMTGRWLGRRVSAADRRDAELRVLPVVNGAVSLLLGLERVASRVLPAPFGSSLVAVARRPLAGPPP